MLSRFLLWSATFQLISICIKATPTDSCKDAPPAVSYAKAQALENSQNATGPVFIGNAAESNPLSPLFVSTPEVSTTHADGGQTGSQDFPGPLGYNTHVRAKAQSAFVFLWGKNNQLTTGYINMTNMAYGLTAIDPGSMDVMAAWYPAEKNQTLNIAYMEYVVATDEIVVSSTQGNIWVVKRGTCQGRPYFRTLRTINLQSQIKQGEQLLTAMFDNNRNIWFTTGAVQLSNDGILANSTTYGYIRPDRKVFKVHVDGETVENGLAIAGANVYMVTSPTGRNNKPNAPGYMYSLSAKDGDIATRWRVPYDAGASTERDPNTAITTRGSGSTPAVLADKYVVITDNDTPRLHVNVYHQAAQKDSKSQLLCQVPLFADNKGSVQNSVLTHYDTEQGTYAIMVLNSYGGPAFFTGQNGQTLNGNYNDMNNMAGGIVRIDVNQNGECKLRWSKNTKSKAISVLSTKNGLVYHYVQDLGSAKTRNEYIWYLLGRDWVTGEEKFRIRAGIGGAFNDNWNGGFLGPDGTFYQVVTSGVVAFKDITKDSY